eukprot:TRINITY_DN5612_c0_g1_i1.p1 TRINITY_DN5612_c0_g1~~TRINITY_DN5612_c0_g1_i1.p1  ORF type:complete len:354 (+),score=55.91 TRINITY_DN5612_c0_g1_i1:89-1150(+)
MGHTSREEIGLRNAAVMCTDDIVVESYSKKRGGKSLAETKYRYTWMIRIGRCRHCLEFQDSKASGYKRVLVDGGLKKEKQVRLAPQFTYAWRLDGHRFCIRPKEVQERQDPRANASWMTALKDAYHRNVDCDFDLEIDGLPFQVFRKSELKLALPPGYQSASAGERAQSARRETSSLGYGGEFRGGENSDEGGGESCRDVVQPELRRVTTATSTSSASTRALSKASSGDSWGLASTASGGSGSSRWPSETPAQFGSFAPWPAASDCHGTQRSRTEAKSGSSWSPSSWKPSWSPWPSTSYQKCDGTGWPDATMQQPILQKAKAKPAATASHSSTAAAGSGDSPAGWPAQPGLWC